MRRICVGDKYIGEDDDCFIIAEAGTNHEGDIKKAFQPFYGETEMYGDTDYDSIWNTYQAIMDKQFFSKMSVPMVCS